MSSSPALLDDCRVSNLLVEWVSCRLLKKAGRMIAKVLCIVERKTLGFFYP